MVPRGTPKSSPAEQIKVVGQTQRISNLPYETAGTVFDSDRSKVSNHYAKLRKQYLTAIKV